MGKTNNQEYLEEEMDVQDVNEETPDIEEETEVKLFVEADEMPKKQENQNRGQSQGRSRKGNRRTGGNNRALAVEIAKQKELVEEANDKYKRLLAEFENARNREKKEALRMYSIGAKEVLEHLLPVVDNFERALMAVPEEDIDRAFEQGVDKIYRQFLVALDEIGVQPIEAVGNQFDPDLHNAVLHIEDEELEENIVVEEMQKGYMYKDTVLRHSMVKVAN